MLIPCRSLLSAGSRARRFFASECLKQGNVGSPSQASSVPVSRSWPNVSPGNHCQWQILLNYMKYLSKRPRECRFERCVNILIAVGDRILQHNKKSQLFMAPTSKWEWYGGVLRPVSGERFEPDEPLGFDPRDLLNMLMILSKLRLYYRINTASINGRAAPDGKLPSKDAGSLGIFGHIIDDVDPHSFAPVSSRFRSGQFGPLRYATDKLVAYPAILSNPVFFELTEVDFLSRLKNPKDDPSQDSRYTRSGFSYFTGTLMVQFLDQLLLLISSSNLSPSTLCILMMYLSVIVYGPKLHNKARVKVYPRVERSLERISDYVCGDALEAGGNLSLRCLAYLVNSCKPRRDLLEFVAARILAHHGPIGEDYLENFCFAFTRSYYDDGRLYERLASLTSEHVGGFSPVVAANLLVSFDRVGKLDLVKAVLLERLGTFSEYELRKLSPGLSERIKGLREDQR